MTASLPTDPRTVTCGTCRYWRKLGNYSGKDLGTCHRFPPVGGTWATTAAGASCGEHIGVTKSEEDQRQSLK